MTEIKTYSEICSGCGICTRTCPYLILRQDPKTKKVQVQDGAARYCSHCGHCEAICPEGAISISYQNAGPVPRVPGLLPSAGEFSSLITMRRSIRDYQKKTVPKETFNQVFNLIRYAPTAMNGQSVHWHVMQNPEDVREFAGRIITWARQVLINEPEHILAPILPMIIKAHEQGSDKVCHGAPHLVFAYSHKDNPVGFIDAVIAMAYLDLVAPVFGLGTCWTGIVERALNSSPELMSSIGLPKDHVSHFTMIIGYPKYQYHRVPKRDAPKITWK